jgi:GT2 family glycosyltransferase
MRRLGMKIAFVPTAVVWHHRRAVSSPRAGWFSAWKKRMAKSPTVNFLSTRNHGWVIIKNDLAANLFIHLIWWLPYEVAKVVASGMSWSALKGEFASLAGWPKMFKKRRELMARAKTASKDLLLSPTFRAQELAT